PRSRDEAAGRRQQIHRARNELFVRIHKNGVTNEVAQAFQRGFTVLSSTVNSNDQASRNSPKPAGKNVCVYLPVSPLGPPLKIHQPRWHDDQIIRFDWAV